MSSSSVPTLLPNVVGLWRHAVEAMPVDASPCPHLQPARWAEMRAACLDFIDRFGAEAHRLGWTTPQLFGVHPRHGTLGRDHCGALIVGGGRASAVDRHRVVFAHAAARRDALGQRFGPPVWEFATTGPATSAAATAVVRRGL